MIVYVIRKIGGNENSPNSLNVMVDYHYHGKKHGNHTVITIYGCLHTLCFLPTQPKDFAVVLKKWKGLIFYTNDIIAVGIYFTTTSIYATLAVPKTQSCANFEFFSF